MSPIDLGENTRRDIILTLEEMGFDVESSYHELAPGQHQIDFRYDEALVTADHIMTFKLAVKGHRQAVRPPRHLHAKAPHGSERLQYAYEHVLVPGG